MPEIIAYKVLRGRDSACPQCINEKIFNGGTILYQKAKETGKPFDAIIMDLTIPGGLGGKETIRRMLEIDPGAKAIVSSGYSSDPVLAEYRGHGFKSVVTKPYRIKDLSETVYSVIHSA